MGQAKARGSFEERKVAAVQREAEEAALRQQTELERRRRLDEERDRDRAERPTRQVTTRSGTEPRGRSLLLATLALAATAGLATQPTRRIDHELPRD